MLKKSKRTTLFNVNGFQRNLFYPVVISFFLGCIISWLSIVYVLIGSYFGYPELYRFQEKIPLLLSLATVMAIFVAFRALRVSGRYFGAYERIITDLDRVLADRSKTPIKAREGDVIFEELLKRINTLIERTQ
ncbi:MAG TPA: hypothetical protein PKV41_06750 [Candidatus Omnitrophota bacterium]|nr:hypothetical protein [Candidatus Omnitrophota bacterium]